MLPILARKAIGAGGKIMARKIMGRKEKVSANQQKPQASKIGATTWGCLQAVAFSLKDYSNWCNATFDLCETNWSWAGLRKALT